MAILLKLPVSKLSGSKILVNLMKISQKTKMNKVIKDTLLKIKPWISFEKSS